VVEAGFSFTSALLQTFFPLCHTASVGAVSLALLIILLKVVVLPRAEKLLMKERVK
jgi:hypothetical protein